MNRKGQTAFETLFLFIVIITGSIAVLSIYSSISEDTNALSIARAETNKQLSMKETNIQIEEINIAKNAGAPTITIKLTQTPAANFLETQTIKQAIQKNTSYKNINVEIN